MAGGNLQHSWFINNDKENLDDNADSTSDYNWYTSNGSDQFFDLTKLNTPSDTTHPKGAFYGFSDLNSDTKCAVERRQFRTPSVSSKRRSKAAHLHNATTKRKGKQRRSLSLLLEMPLDVLYEVCPDGHDLPYVPVYLHSDIRPPPPKRYDQLV